MKPLLTKYVIHVWVFHDYRPDYNNRPSNSISFMTVVPRTSGLLHCERVLILFPLFLLFQEFLSHKQTTVTTCFVFVVWCSQWLPSVIYKSKLGNSLTKAVSLCINLNIDDTPIAADKIRKYRIDYNNNPPFCLLMNRELKTRPIYETRLIDERLRVWWVSVISCKKMISLQPNTKSWESGWTTRRYEQCHQENHCKNTPK
jgi:hypothetical protein